MSGLNLHGLLKEKPRVTGIALNKREPQVSASSMNWETTVNQEALWEALYSPVLPSIKQNSSKIE